MQNRKGRHVGGDSGHELHTDTQNPISRGKMRFFSSHTPEGWGLVLIILGVSAWAPYGVLKYGFGQEVNVVPFLSVHLTGVIPGALLKRGPTLSRWLTRQNLIDKRHWAGFQ